MNTLEQVPPNTLSTFKAWILTIRPKMFPMWIIPVLVGTMLAPLSLSAIDWKVVLCTLLAAIFTQIGTHCINDVLDPKNTVDSKERLGPIRGVHLGILSPKSILYVGYVSFALVLFLGALMAMKGGISIFVFCLLAVACGYTYTAGPFPLSYVGIADLFGLIFFGWLSVGVAYYLQTAEVSILPFLAGTQIGLLTIAPLAINNLRDHITDAKGNKRTLIVRWGPTFGRWEITTVLTLPFFIGFLWIPLGYMWAAFLPLLIAPLAIYLIANIWKHAPSRLYNKFLALSALVDLLFGLCLIIAFRINLD